MLTYTLVPAGAEVRMGVDRDSDTFFDSDELDQCSDPADPDDIPTGSACPGDTNGDNTVDLDDLLSVIGAWGTTDSPADLDCSGTVDLGDLLEVIGNWGSTC